MGNLSSGYWVRDQICPLRIFTALKCKFCPFMDGDTVIWLSLNCAELLSVVLGTRRFIYWHRPYCTQVKMAIVSLLFKINWPLWLCLQLCLRAATMAVAQLPMRCAARTASAAVHMASNATPDSVAGRRACDESSHQPQIAYVRQAFALLNHSWIVCYVTAKHFW